MAILKQQPSGEIAAAFEAGVRQYLLGPAERSNVTERFAGPEPQIPTLEQIGHPGPLGHSAIPVYVLGLNDVAESRGIGAAVLSGWRVYAGNAPRSTVMGRVTRRAQGAWKLTGVYYGDQVWEAIEAWLSLESLTHVNEADYELRVLDIPGLNMETFWLASRMEGKEDLVVPFLSGGALNPKEVFTMANFLGVIRPKAILQIHTTR